MVVQPGNWSSNPGIEKLGFTAASELDHSERDGEVKSGRTQKKLSTALSIVSQVVEELTGLKLAMAFLKRDVMASERHPPG